MGLISGQAGPSHNEVSCSLSETGAEKATKLQFFPLAQQASSKDVTAWRFSRSEKAGLGANARRRRWSCLGKPTGLPKWLEWAGWWFWSIKWWSRPASPESSTSAEHWGIYSYCSRSSANSGKREKRNLFQKRTVRANYHFLIGHILSLSFWSTWTINFPIRWRGGKAIV